MVLRLLGDRRIGDANGDITGFANGTLAGIWPTRNDLLVTASMAR